MQIIPVGDFLSPAGLEEPGLHVLAPTQENFIAQFLQPKGTIEITSNGVQHVDRPLVQEQFRAFLRDAAQLNAHLVVTCRDGGTTCRP